MEQEIIFKKITTRRHSSLRTILWFEIITRHALCSQNTKQANIHRGESLTKSIHLIPPTQIKLRNETIAKVVKPLYALCHSGDYYINTIQRPHLYKLRVIPILTNNAFFPKDNGYISVLRSL